ncbi:ABC transporter G family member 26 [Capsicum chinense]|nr:ABC transporter G family member 26 [Capsicum chinense]
MEHLRQDEIEDLSLSPPAVSSMQNAGSNGFGHNIEFMSQAYLRNRSSKIDIEVEDDTSIADKDQPFPIFLKFTDVEYKVKISQASSNNTIKAVVSKEAFVFAAFLRLPRKMSQCQKYERAVVIIKELGLERENPGMHMLFSGLKEEVSIAFGLLCGMAAVAKKEAAHSALPRKRVVRKGRLSYGNENSKVTWAGEHFTKCTLKASEIFEIQSEQHWVARIGRRGKAVVEVFIPTSEIKDRDSRADLFQDQMIHLFVRLGELTWIGQIRGKEPIKERSDAISNAVHNAELPTR